MKQTFRVHLYLAICSIIEYSEKSKHSVAVLAFPFQFRGTTSQKALIEIPFMKGFHEIAGRLQRLIRVEVSMIRKLLLSLFFALLIVLVVSKFGSQVALAQFAFEQAFGVRGVANVDGSRAQVWTAQQANALTFRASPVFVCQDNPCNVGFIEAGYAKGLFLTGNILKAYSTWEKTNGVSGQKMDIQNLNDNTWYDFMVWYKNGANPRWIIKVNDIQVYTPENNIPDWIQGDSVGCGAEGGEDNINIAVQCANMKYRPIGGAGVWTLYNYNNTQTTAGYCVVKPADWGALGWGPGC